MNTNNETENNFPLAKLALSKLKKSEVPYLFEEKLFHKLNSNNTKELSIWEKLFTFKFWIPSTAGLTVASLAILLLAVNNNLSYQNPFNELPKERVDIVEVDNQEHFNIESNTNLRRDISTRSSMLKVETEITKRVAGFKVLTSSEDEKRELDSLRNSVFSNLK